MIETQKNRIDTMTREELQGILIDSDLYTPEVIEYVKSRLRGTTWQQSSYAASEARPKAHVGFSSAYKAFFKNYVNFKGRSRRSELWYVGLANVLIVLIAYILLIPDFLLMSEGIGDIANQMIEIIVIVGFLFTYELICFVPNLSLSVRRLHDIGKSGWYLLMGCIPIIGTIILFVYSVTDSDSGDNRYGKNPKLYPDKVHENKSGAVLAVILSALAVAIAVSAFRVVDFIDKHNTAVINGESLYDDTDNSYYDVPDISDYSEDYDNSSDYYDYSEDYDNSSDYSYYSYDDSDYYDEDYYNYYNEYGSMDAFEDANIYYWNSKYITYDYLDNLTRSEVALERNKIYARHGYIFDTEPYRTYFNTCIWYRPNPDFTEDMLSAMEKENRNIIVRYEKEKGWR